MKQDELLKKIWRENELTVLARSHRACEEINEAVQHAKAEAVFARLTRIYRTPPHNWKSAAVRVWEMLQDQFVDDYSEFEALLAELDARYENDLAREKLRLWLWRRVVRAGKPVLTASRFFADEFLFQRTLHDDRLILWYGARQAEWPVQLLLGLFLGGREDTHRLRLTLYWPTARLPDDFQASRTENRALRRLWEARILVRFSNWMHLHPEIMLLLPEISSFSSPVFEWRESNLFAHMPDGRIWPVPPFALAGLVFDESLALFGKDRQALWRNFSAYATDYLSRPEDVASNFVSKFFDELGLHVMREATRPFLTDFAEGINYLETLRTSLAGS